MENKGQTRKCEIQIQLLIKFLFHHLNIIYIVLDIHSGSAKTPTSHHIRKWTSIFCTDPRQVSSQSLMGIIFLSIMYCSSYLYIESHLCVFRQGPTRSNSAWSGQSSGSHQVVLLTEMCCSCTQGQQSI